MKAFGFSALVLSCVLPAQLAHASPVRVDTQLDLGQEVKTLRYRLDNLKSSALIEVDLDKYVDGDFDHSGYANRGLKTLTYEVPGLSYDVPNLRVVYDGERGRVICANVTETRGVFGQRYITVQPTGRCRAFGERTVDRTYEEAPVYQFSLYFEAAEQLP